VPSVEGAQLVLNAPPTYDLGGKTYTWQSWSDGGAISHTIVAAGSTSTYTAVYSTPGEEPPAGGGSTGGGSTGGGSTGGGGGASGGGGGSGATPPNTALGKHPPKSTRSSVAKFTFSASRPGATFSCKLDGKPKAACRSPKTYKKLKPGKHTFKVWASAGVLADTTPVKYSWKVLPPKR
jgi:hypothetical protein